MGSIITTLETKEPAPISVIWLNQNGVLDLHQINYGPKKLSNAEWQSLISDTIRRNGQPSGQPKEGIEVIYWGEVKINGNIEYQCKSSCIVLYQDYDSAAGYAYAHPGPGIRF